MEKTVIVSKRFRKNILNIHQYLLKEFSPTIANGFLERLEKRVEFIIQNPEAGKPSQKRKNVRSLLFTPHNQIFYRVQKNKIELLCITDMRKNPAKRSY
ncbi:MAG: type II toxin-antitoxin system RelE/ParE family toxin [Chitinophagaceae bacterium]|nr:type II toxin-antitoxin system RelE/ParE family toxin [Chitinophagaceae bacterium]